MPQTTLDGYMYYKPEPNVRKKVDTPFSKFPSRGQNIRLPVEIWRLVGEQVFSFKDLKALTNTCSDFRHIYLPFLHTRKTFQLHTCPPGQTHLIIPSRFGMPDGFFNTHYCTRQLHDMLCEEHSIQSPVCDEDSSENGSEYQREESDGEPRPLDQPAGKEDKAICTRGQQRSVDESAPIEDSSEYSSEYESQYWSNDDLPVDLNDHDELYDHDDGCFGSEAEVPYPSHTKLLTNINFVIHDGQKKVAEPPEWGEVHEYHTRFIKRILQDTSNLKSFQWIDMFDGNKHNPSAWIFWNTGLLGKLKSYKSLKRLSIQFASLSRFIYGARQGLRLSGFQDLSSLSLTNLPVSTEFLAEDIAKALSDCPLMKHLALGLACKKEEDEGLLYPVIPLLSGRGFLRSLCQNFHARSDRSLALNSLELGHGMCMFDLEKHHDNFLELLVNISVLKTLEIFNGTCLDDLHHGTGASPMLIDWTLLEGCTSLTRVVVTLMTNDFSVWILDARRGSVNEHVVLDPSRKYMSDGIQALLPRCSLLSTNAISEERLIIKDNSVVCTSFIPNLSSISFVTAPKLIQLALWIDRDDHEMKTRMENIIRGLQCLRLMQLRIYTKPLEYSNEDSAFDSCLLNDAKFRFPVMKDPKKISYEYAILMSSACSTLQYIRIADWAWHIVTSADGTVTFHEMGHEEIQSIFLFAIDAANTTSGLLNVEEPRDLRGYHGY